MNNKITYDIVKKSFNLANCKLLSTEYKNAKTNLLIECIKGHKHKITWSNWKLYGERNNCMRISFEDVRKSFELENYTLVSKRYTGNQSRLRFICPKGHNHQIRWAQWNSGQRCGICNKELYPKIDKIRKSFGNENYKLLSKKYVNRFLHLKFLCPNGHTHGMTWPAWKSGHRCGKCSFMVSKAEKEIVRYVRSLRIKVIENDRKTIFNPITDRFLELDVWMPKLKKTIEYNGIYWHYNNHPTDAIKKKLCREKNIQLLVIRDLDWKNNPDMCRHTIKEFINAK